jgi:hypothetical protein
MDSSHSERLTLIGEIRESSRAGNWDRANVLAGELREQSPPIGYLQAAEYLEQLRAALVVAKASRAHMIATLNRMNAAAGFNEGRLE